MGADGATYYVAVSIEFSGCRGQWQALQVEEPLGSNPKREFLPRHNRVPPMGYWTSTSQPRNINGCFYRCYG